MADATPRSTRYTGIHTGMTSLNRREFLLSLGAGAAAVAYAAEVPRPAPELAIRMVNGQQLLLSQFKGKVIAVEFLMTTCPHCQNASVLLEKFYREYGSRGFQPVGVAFNDMAALLVPDYVKQLGLTYPVGIAPREEVIAYIQHPMAQILYVPQLVFIDRNFVIRGQYSGTDDFFKNEEANMRNIIEKLVKEPAKANGGRSGRPGARKPASKSK